MGILGRSKNKKFMRPNIVFNLAVLKLLTNKRTEDTMAMFIIMINQVSAAFRPMPN